MEKWMQDSLKGFVGGFLVLPIFSILNVYNKLNDLILNQYNY